MAAAASTQAPVSKRAEKICSTEHFLNKYQIDCMNNTYHATGNPQGVVNMGTATNQLMGAEVQQRLRRPDALRFTAEEHQHYYDFGGTPRLRRALCSFLQRHFSRGREISPHQLAVVNGVTACFEVVAGGVMDAGEVLLTPTPVYASVFADFTDRPLIDVQALPLRPEDGFRLTAAMLDARIQELALAGKPVKAFILLNPNNPLGCNYDEATVRGLMDVCARHQVHVIVDEIYALSQHHASNSFRSVLSYGDLPDPSRTHVLWGPSKDFGLAGFRVGVIHTTNRRLMDYIDIVGFYQVTPSIVHDAVATILDDKEWCDDFFIPTNQRRLRESHQAAVARLRGAGIEVVSAQAALFGFANLGPYLSAPTREAELELFSALYAAGVYVVPGTELYCCEPGWFRLVLSVDASLQSLGLDRMMSVLEKRGPVRASERQEGAVRDRERQ